MYSINDNYNNLNQLLMKSTKENVNLLQTTFKTSPKTPKTQTVKKKLSNSSRRKRQKANAVRQSSWQLEANQILNTLNNNKLIKSTPNQTLVSELSETSKLQQQQNELAESINYNLIEYHGDSSRNIKNMNDLSSISSKVNQSSWDSSKRPLKIENSSQVENTPAITVQQIEKKIIFFVPEEFASSIEIMKIQVGNSTKSNSPTTTIVPLPLHFQQTSNSVGPIRRKVKKNKTNRNVPYRHPQYNNSNKRGHFYENLNTNKPMVYSFENQMEREFAYNDYKYNVPGAYPSQNVQQNSNSIGPIRNKNTRKNRYKESSIFSPYQNSAYKGAAFNNNAYNRKPYIRNVPESTDNYYSKISSSKFSVGYVNERYSRNQNWKTTYNKFGYQKVRLCWNCSCNSHLFKNCPLPLSQLFCKACGNPGTDKKNCRKCYYR